MTAEVKRLVFVPNKGPHDYTDAYHFGELVFCTEGKVNRKDLRTMQSQVALALDDAEPEDYILVSGLASLCIVACALFAHRFGRLNVLLFEEGEYIERSLLFDQQ